MKLGFIGRFKPLHNGAARTLKALCGQADQVTIGIGSCNKYNARNPFTAEESEDMIRLILQKYHNYNIIFIPDFAHIPGHQDGQKWREHVKEQYGNLDHFVSGNPYVIKLLERDYDIINPSLLIPSEKQIWLRATKVRIEMARKGDWQRLVPKPVAEYIKQNKLDERFRREFGLETLAKFVNKDYQSPDLAQEKEHTQEK